MLARGLSLLTGLAPLWALTAVAWAAFVFALPLFGEECRARLGPERARGPLPFLLLYPVAFFFAAAYTESLFLLLLLLAFRLIRTEQPLAAVFVGLLLGLTRAPAAAVGPALALAYVLRPNARKTLPMAAALMGNTVVFKPATQTLLVCHFLMELLNEAGLPPGVVNMVSGSASEISEQVLAHKSLAGIHFTGSTEVFQGMWKEVGANIDRYRTYPRLVGETGGKDFIVAHSSADPEALRTAMVRGAFEYQGQKCSAASRAYIPQSIWKTLRSELIDQVEALPQGDVSDFRNFMGAVIDGKAYAKHMSAIQYANKAEDAKVIAGGKGDDKVGWFVRPTVIETKNPDFKTMREELFGPILTVYPYPDSKFEETLDLCDRTSPYGLTGAIFATDRSAIRKASETLVNAAGNFYINDKPTGAVVGLQPFGGARASGTNDKAGSFLNLIRWTSPRTIKETYVPPTDHRYPYMDAE